MLGELLKEHVSVEELKLLEKLHTRVKSELRNSERQCKAHGLDHMERVLKNAVMLAERFDNTDYSVLGAACLLHDIDHPVEGKEEHVDLSVRKAEKIMRELNFPDGKLRKILDVISKHSSEKIEGIDTIEARILFDADKLDGVGAVGIARVFLYCGQKKMDIKKAIEWYRRKIDIAMKNMQTEEGKKIAERRLRYVHKFLERLEKEM